MRWPAVAIEIASGLVYLLLGGGAVIESVRGAGSGRHRRFGLALAALALTGGVQAGLSGLDQLGGEGGNSGPLLAATLLAMVPATVFCWLRSEAYLAGSGDRIIHGNPSWVSLLPVALAFLAGAILVTAWAGRGRLTPAAGPDALVAVTLIVVGWYLMRAQQVRHGVAGGWSLSGLAVTLIFPTWAVLEVTEIVAGEVAGMVGFAGWLAVPAAGWFVIECRRVAATGKRSGSRATLAVSPQRARRPAPWARTGSL